MKGEDLKKQKKEEQKKDYQTNLQIINLVVSLLNIGLPLITGIIKWILKMFNSKGGG